MQIITARGGLFSTNAFLIADETSKQAVVFDTPDNTVGVLLDKARRNDWNVIGLWLTHGHCDHIADHAVVTEAYPDARVLLHRLDEPKLQNPNAMFPLPFMIPPRKPDAYVEDGQLLTIGSLTARVIHTPGHSSGHVCYHFADQKLLVGGDLIICGAVGRTDFADGDLPTLNRSIRMVMKLPADTRLLPGHCDPTTLGHELQTNPYVQEAVEG